MQDLIRCRLVRSLNTVDLTSQIADVEILAIPRMAEIVMPNLSGTAKKYQVKQIVYAGKHKMVPAEVLLVVDELPPVSGIPEVGVRVIE
jgi:hypothetical protein